MTSLGLRAYTMRLFDRQRDDGDLDALFLKTRYGIAPPRCCLRAAAMHYLMRSLNRYCYQG